MASQESLLVGPLGWPSVVHKGGANTISKATKAAAPNQSHVLSGVSISASAAPTLAVTVTLKDGVTVIDQWEIPAAAFAPFVIEYKRPFVISVNNLVELEIPALGVGVVSTAVIRGLTRPA